MVQPFAFAATGHMATTPDMAAMVAATTTPVRPRLRRPR